MKFLKLIIYIYLFISGLTVYAQSDSILYETYYKLTQAKNDQSLSSVENIMLIISKNNILERNYDAFKRDTAGYKKFYMNATKASPEVADKAVSNTINSRAFDRQLIYDLTQNTVSYYRGMGRPYFYVSAIPVYQFVITQEKRNISGYNCRKATGVNKGLKWDIWFCEDINIKANPLGMTEIPGLIIKATETTTNTNYELIKFNKGSKVFKSIAMPDYATLITKDEMTVFEEQFNNDRPTFIKNHLPPGFSVKVKQ